MAYAPPRKRPIGVLILAILVIIGGVLLTIVALLAVLGSSVILASGTPGAGLIVALSFIFLLLSLLLLGSGIGLYNLRPWAWWLTIIVLFLVLLNNVSGWLAGGVGTSSLLLSLIIPGILFVYLLAVRGHFRARPGYVPAPRPR